MRTPEPELLQNALEALENATGLTAYVDAQPIPKKGDVRPDAKIRLVYNQQEWPFVVEIKARPTNAALGHIAAQLERLGPRALLVAQYINPNQAEHLRELEIPFIDTAGNAYLNEPPLYIFITGRKPTNAGEYCRPRAITPAALRVVFALLCQPTLVTAPLRTIAKTAGVALGAAKYALDALKEGDYVFTRGTPPVRVFRNKLALLDVWVAAYADTLRPKLLRGRYLAAETGWWETVDITDYHAQWGGEVAADRMTHYLKPEVLTIYMDRNVKPGRLLVNQKLKKHPKGNVEILEKFWQFPEQETRDTVPPLLTYADLVATADARTIETAKLIYEQCFTPLMEND